MAAFLSAFIVTATMLYGALRHGVGLWMDIPNERSLHHQAVPRVGGLFLIGATLLAATPLVATVGTSEIGRDDMVLISIALLLTLSSAFDDRHSLPILPRLLLHLGGAAAFSLTISAISIEQAVAITGLGVLFAWLTLTVCTSWFINMYNFMDGADGLAGLMTTIGFACYAWMAPQGSAIAIFSAALAGAAAGFLSLNWHPARVFLGDAGSIPIGFLAAAIGFAGAEKEYWPYWTPLALFLPFLFDATATIAIRLLEGKKIWRAHREHAYQRLILSGVPPARVALKYGLLMAICAITVATTAYQTKAMSILLWAVIIAVHGGVLLKARHVAGVDGRHE